MGGVTKFNYEELYAASLARESKLLDENDALETKLAALQQVVEQMQNALSELVDGIEGAGGHDENGDVFDIGPACTALAAASRVMNKSVESGGR